MPNKTALYGRWGTPGGVMAIESQDITTGNRFYVDSGAANAGSTASYGNDPNKPLTSLALAFSLNKPTPNNGDIIYLMPGHTESVIAAAGIACDIAGVTVKGLGSRETRPVISFTTDANADIDIDGANITIENISFRCDIADLAAAIDVNAANFHMRNCSFIGTDAADEAFLISIITDAAANGMVIEDCQFYYRYAADGTTAITTTSTECIRLVGADRAVIKDCYMHGDFTTSAINGITTASLDIQILGNRILNIATENITGCIDLVAACTGHIDGNICYADDPTSPDDLIDASSCVLGRNYVSNETGEAPSLYGTQAAEGLEGKVDLIDTNLDTLLAEFSGTAGIATWKTAAAAANGVSLSEAIRYMSELQIPRIVVKESGDLTSFGTSLTLFTVTGDVLCRVGASVDVAVTCTSGTSTLEVGVVGNTACLCVQDAVDATAFAIGDSWSLVTAADANGAAMADEWALIGNGVDIILTGSVDDMTAGEIDFYCQYIPLTAASSVVAA